jgi:hypothetical protein
MSPKESKKLFLSSLGLVATGACYEFDWTEAEAIH